MPRPPSRLRSVPVPDLPADPLEVVLALGGLAGSRRLAALSGAWAGGSVVVTADPVRVVEDAAGPAAGAGSGDDPDPEVLERLLGALDEEVPVTRAPGTPAAAVGGGWVVLLGHRVGRLTGRVRTPGPPVVGPWLPAASAGLHDAVLRFDGRWWAESLDPGDGSAPARAEALVRRVHVGLAGPHRPGGRAERHPGPVLEHVPDARAHMAAVEQVLTAVRAGDIAQANVCSRFGLRLDDGGPAAVRAWAALVRALGPDRAALVTGPWGALVGASPESYLSTADGQVTSSPIKGTRPLGEDRSLRASVKDTSENVMIVDLVRNDLARVSEPGSVRVEELLAVRAHTGVSHLVSRVAGTLRPGTGVGEVVRATFPPGSVTGTPKQRATEVTEEVETAARGAHTGAVGLVGLRPPGTTGTAELAVTIRSLEVGPDGTAALGVGGGIVADSTPAEEWHEVLTKAAPLLRALGLQPPTPDPTTASTKGLGDPALGLLETVLAVDGRVVEVADHVARLRRSVWETTGRLVPGDVEGLLVAAAARAGAGAHRLRLRVVPAARPADPDPGEVPLSEVEVEVEPWHRPRPPAEQPGLVLGVVPAPPQGLERHKYADRRWLADAVATAGAVAGAPVDDVAFAAPDGLLETSRACLVAVVAGRDSPGLVTPACDGRVLPGTTRQVLLDLARLRGWPVRLAALDEAVLSCAEGLLACNSLRGAQWVAQVGDHRWAGPSPALVGLAGALLERWRLPAGG